MALRPASKTLSSLTGIVVMAAVLWALLNFVWAPSCGRFGCSYVPSWWPQAQADGGGCPNGLAGAADDAEWAAARIAELADEPLTTGWLYRSDDGSATKLGSGPDRTYHDVALKYTGGLAGVLDQPPGHQLAEHVEVKAAALMREAGATLGVLVINHPRGPCNYASGIGCVAAVPLILAKGTSLVVWSPNGRRTVFEGRA